MGVAGFEPTTVGSGGHGIASDEFRSAKQINDLVAVYFRSDCYHCAIVDIQDGARARTAKTRMRRLV
jgi:hypothetical protein